MDYRIINLNPFTEYSVCVIAVNERGLGAASDEKLIRTFSSLPTEAPNNVTFEPSSTVSNCEQQLEIDM